MKQLIGLLLDFDATTDFPDLIELDGLKIKKISPADINKAIDALPGALSDGEKTRWTKVTHALYAPFSEANRQKMYRIPQLLRIIRRTKVLVATLTQEDDRDERSAYALWRTLPSQILLLGRMAPGDSTFTKDDVTKIIQYQQIYDKIAAQKGYHRLASACFFFESYYHSYQIRTSCPNLLIALEALFNTDKAEIAYKIQLRCAFFLGQTPDERKKIFDDLKEIYKLRSALVHGQSVGKKIYKDPQVGAKYTLTAERYARECLQVIFEKDYFDAFSGDDKNLTARLDSLILGVSKNF